MANKSLHDYNYFLGDTFIIIRNDTYSSNLSDNYTANSTNNFTVNSTDNSTANPNSYVEEGYEFKNA